MPDGYGFKITSYCFYVILSLPIFAWYYNESCVRAQVPYTGLFLTEDILMNHSRKSKAVNNEINDGSVLLLLQFRGILPS